MEEGNNQDTLSLEKKINVFEVWKEYEKIAMHFNELIIQLRVRALAGVGAVSALVVFTSKEAVSGNYNWGILSAVLLFLWLAWVAIWVLDKFFYDRLLSGAIDAVVELEDKTILNMSAKIEESVKDASIDGRKWFYGIIFWTLFFGDAFSFYRYCLTTQCGWS